MSLLFDVIFASGCTSTHHKLALDALRQLRCRDAAAWRDLFLKHHKQYLAGAKAPDDQFKDFKNHVLHVRDGFWGGAVEACRQWYGRTVDALRNQQWPEAVYAAGVLSHYYTDPIMPLHTGQTEEEGAVHRPAEWSFTCSYDDFTAMLQNELGGYPDVEVPNGSDWLATMVRRGAEKSNPLYEVVIDHYDIHRGVKDPKSGLDDHLRRSIAGLIGYASVGWARILDRALDESAVQPPSVSISLQGFLATLTVPIKWVTRKMADSRQRAVVESMYAELQLTGKVIETLPADDRTVRAMHAEEVLKVPLSELNARKPRPTGTCFAAPSESRAAAPKAERVTPAIGRAVPAAAAKPATTSKVRANSTPVAPATKTAANPPRSIPNAAKVTAAKPATTPARSSPTPEPAPAVVALSKQPTKPAPKALKFHLEPSSPIVDAPSIGGKTADRLRSIGVRTVAELLALSPEQAAERLHQGHIKPDTIRDWQNQARLACRVPGIRGHDAQILVGCGVTEPEQLAAMQPDKLMDDVEMFLATSEGKRVLRTSDPPDMQEVTHWIELARSARQLKAA